MTELDALLAACATVQSDSHAARSTKAMAAALGAWAPTVQPPAPAPAPSPTPPYLTCLFVDEFDGPAGSPPDPAKWVNVDGIYYDAATSRAKAANATLDGNGHLRLRVTRDAAAPGGFWGAIVGTYRYQTGWPPKPVLASWPVPFRWEARILYNAVPGSWQTGGWLQNVDRSTGLAELDCGELRGGAPAWFGANQHLWSGSTDTKREGAGVTFTPGAWHIAAVEVTSTETRYFCDGNLVATHSGVTGSLGVLLHNVIAGPSSWGSNYGAWTPAATDPGPWDTLIDYARVTAL